MSSVQTLSGRDVIHKFWEEFNLEEKKKVTFEQATEIAKNQDQLQPARKLLAAANKEFVNLEPQKKLASCRDLIRSYQKEIDRLTKAETYAETAFLSLYRDLANAPDLKEYLQSAKQDQEDKEQSKAGEAKINQLKLENEKLKRELHEFRKDFQEIKNQEVTIRNLEEQLRQHKLKMNEMIQKQLEERELAIREEVLLKYEKLNEHHEELKKQLKQAKDDLIRSQEHAAITQTQLLDMKTKFDAEMSAKRSEVDLISNEIERTNAAYQELREKHANLLQQTEPQHENSLENWGEIVQKDMEISQLRETVASLKEKEAQQQAEMKRVVTRLTSQLESQTAKNQALTEQLSKIPDPDQIVKLENKVKVLEALCGSYAKEEAASSGGSSVGGEGLSVENALRNKNRQLNSEIIQLKSELASSVQRVATAEKKISELQIDLLQKQAMLTKWESDFDQLRQWNTDPHLNAIADISLEGSTGQPIDESGVLQMIWSQRDRFKAKIHDLETSNRLLEQKVKAYELQLKASKSDNVKLYEKIKFLQSYTTTTQQQQSSSSDGNTADVENRYKEIYEATLNPFVEFNKKVRTDKYKTLNPAERVILSTTKFFLATKYTRLFLFLYMICLHMLVFSTLWKMVHL